MILAEVEVRHSRPIAPTRRVALGDLWLPGDPPPGFGGILLAGIVGTFAPKLDDELREGLERLIEDVEANRPIPQPRLRHRFQVDTVGLDRSHHVLIGAGKAMALELPVSASPAPQVLAAVYAAGRLPAAARANSFRLLRRAVHWVGDDDELLRYLLREEPDFRDWRQEPGDLRWAYEVLGFESTDEVPDRRAVLRRFRQLVRDAHPDKGADDEGAGRRITDLTNAKRILVTEVP